MPRKKRRFWVWFSSIFLGLRVRREPVFLHILGDILQNQFSAVGILFLHNSLIVAFILLGMTFYVNLVVLKFFKQEEHTELIITHPRSFAAIFACSIVFLSMIPRATLSNGEITVETHLLILLISASVGVVEGYDICFTIKKTLGRIMSMKGSQLHLRSFSRGVDNGSLLHNSDDIFCNMNLAGIGNFGF